MGVLKVWVDFKRQLSVWQWMVWVVFFQSIQTFGAGGALISDPSNTASLSMLTLNAHSSPDPRRDVGLMLRTPFYIRKKVFLKMLRKAFKEESLVLQVIPFHFNQAQLEGQGLSEFDISVLKKKERSLSEAACVLEIQVHSEYESDSQKSEVCLARVSGFEAHLIQSAKCHIETLKKIRSSYTEEVKAMQEEGVLLLASQETKENVARRLSQKRRELGLKYKEETPEELRQLVYGRNLEKYGDPLGPTFEYLVQSARQRGFEGDAIWDLIIQKSTMPNEGLNQFIHSLESEKKDEV